jgi:hypothetical protein
MSMNKPWVLYVTADPPDDDQRFADETRKRRAR